MKRELRLQARQFRAEGMAVRNIAEVMNLPTSAISLWVRDVVLTPARTNGRAGQQNEGVYSLPYSRQGRTDQACDILAVTPAITAHSDAKDVLQTWKR